MTEERASVVDFSTPYGFDRFAFISHKSGNLPMSEALLWPFSAETWLTLIASLVSLRFVVQIMHQMEMSEFAFRRWFSASLKAILLGRSMNWMNRKWSHLCLLMPLFMIFVITRCKLFVNYIIFALMLLTLYLINVQVTDAL